MPFRLCRKGTSLPRRIAGVSVRQESLRRPRRKYSPEGTPRGSLWETWNLFVLKTSIIREEPAMSLLILGPKGPSLAHVMNIDSQQIQFFIN